MDKRMCACEHESHFEDATEHSYATVPAGRRVAMYVGPICDECADGHYAEYVQEWSKQTPASRLQADETAAIGYAAAYGYLAERMAQIKRYCARAIQDVDDFYGLDCVHWLADIAVIAETATKEAEGGLRRALTPATAPETPDTR